jgi:hypothetical protein
MRHEHDARHGRRERHRRRKERILHTRISDELEDDLRRAAEELRVPVSNLVRNLLEEAVSVVEAVSDEVGDWIDEVVGSAEEVADRVQSRRDRGAQDGQQGRSGRGRWTEAARAARAARASEPLPSEEAPQVLGWQPLVLDREQRCECGRVLLRGRPAHVALTTAGLVGRYRCESCIAGLEGSEGAPGV